MRVKISQIIYSYRYHKSFSAAARELRIDRRTVKYWILKAKTGYGEISPKGLKRKSTRPKKIHKIFSDEVENRIIELRTYTGYDARKLKHELLRKDNISVSPATIYRIIKKKEPNLLGKVKNHLRPKFQNGKSMRPSNTTQPGYLQMDVKYVTPELSGFPFTTYEYAAIDVFSRFKLALILPVMDESGSILTLKYVLQQAPFKVVYIQTDNGFEFQRQFHKVCEDLDLVHYYIHKSSPNENAVIERSFRTDQEEFFFRMPKIPKNINDLNVDFQKYLTWYNNDRIHMGLEYKTPVEKLQEYNLTIGGQ